MKTMLILFLLTLTLLFTGCAAPLPHYSPSDLPAGSKKATLDLRRVGNIKLGLKDKIYRAYPPDNNLLDIPATGEPVVIHYYSQIEGYQVVYYCAPSMAFIPLENEKYLLNFEWADGMCSIEPFRYNPDDEFTGLSLVRIVPLKNLKK